jgi:N6-L-threonylcarbamoyladenine synthase
MTILGIETSCDETSASIVEDGKNIISNAVFSQVELHSEYNGVVPEIASRNHLLKILDIIETALDGFLIEKIDAIAVTKGPGLIGALLVGLSTAKAIAYTHNIPLIPVNHILAHMYAPHLTNDIPFPYIELVVSGGHTLLYRVDGFDYMELLGSTIDDAVGEAFDKVAKLLRLGYPGGPVIDKRAQNGNPDFLTLPRGLPDTQQDIFNFSYSGLKTAIAYRVKDITDNPQDLPPDIIDNICASFQKTAIDMLYRKSINAVNNTGINRLVISGGVAANSFLRQRFDALKEQGLEVYNARMDLCGDNAAMVAGRGYVDYQSGKVAELTLEAFSRLPYVKKGKRIVRRG